MIKLTRTTSALLASLVLLSACTSLEDKQVSVCQKIAELYSPVTGYNEITVEPGSVYLNLKVKAALKELAGEAECRFEAKSDVPYYVRLGNAEHTTSQDIDDLMHGRYLDGEGLPEHAH